MLQSKANHEIKVNISSKGVIKWENPTIQQRNSISRLN